MQYFSLRLPLLLTARIPVARMSTEGELPLNNDRGSDQQREKNRQQHRGDEPLTKAEFVGIGHVTAFWLGRNATLSVTDNSRGSTVMLGV